MLLYAESERLSLALAGLESIVAECSATALLVFGMFHSIDVVELEAPIRRHAVCCAVLRGEILPRLRRCFDLCAGTHGTHAKCAINSLFCRVDIPTPVTHGTHDSGFDVLASFGPVLRLLRLLRLLIAGPRLEPLTAALPKIDKEDGRKKVSLPLSPPPNTNNCVLCVHMVCCSRPDWHLQCFLRGCGFAG